MKIYITKMWFSSMEEDKVFYKQAYILMSSLEAKEYQIVYIKDGQFKVYDEIFK